METTSHRTDPYPEGAHLAPSGNDKSENISTGVSSLARPFHNRSVTSLGGIERGLRHATSTCASTWTHTCMRLLPAGFIFHAPFAPPPPGQLADHRHDSLWNSVTHRQNETLFMPWSWLSHWLTFRYARCIFVQLFLCNFVRNYTWLGSGCSYTSMHSSGTTIIIIITEFMAFVD